jgi:hypothetical protein
MSLASKAPLTFASCCLVAVIAQFCAVRANAQTPEQAPASFDELRAQAKSIESAHASSAGVPKLVEEWLNTKDIDSLDIAEIQWCLAHSLPNRTNVKSFSVVWSGFLTPPRTGAYTFSVSPINVNNQFGADKVRHRITASVAGTVVVDAGPTTKEKSPRGRGASARSLEAPADEWEWKGTPAELQAGRPVPIRVEMEYECSEPSSADSPHAIVSWEGPGIERQAITSDVLTPPDRHGKGLQADFRWQDGSQASTVTQASPAIDYAWSTPADVAPANPELVAQLTNRLWQLSTAPEYLAECAAGLAVHPYFDDNHSVEFLSSAQRREFLQLLVDNKELLSRVEDDKLLRLFRTLRFDAEDQSIDLLGTWMQLHADVTPKITADFFRENRRVYAELAIHLARQQQGAYRLLGDRYLEMPDGRCALPVAYTLTYCERIASRPIPDLGAIKTTQSRSSEWFDKLDAMLEDAALAGDQRVNWLIAKAQSVEPRRSTPSGANMIQENYLAAESWLSEAHLVADSASVRARVYKEEFARMVALNRAAQMKELLRAVVGTIPDQDLRQWSDAAAAIERFSRSQQLADSEFRRTAYIRVMERRRQQAVNRNDQQAIGRYDRILQAHSSDAAN